MIFASNTQTSSRPASHERTFMRCVAFCHDALVYNPYFPGILFARWKQRANKSVQFIWRQRRQSVPPTQNRCVVTPQKSIPTTQKSSNWSPSFFHRWGRGGGKLMPVTHEQTMTLRAAVFELSEMLHRGLILLPPPPHCQ